MFRKDELERRTVELDFPNAEDTFHYKFTSLIAETMRRLRPFFTEDVYVSGRENLREGSDPNGEPLKGPLSFIVGHESYWDFTDLPPEWSTLPRKPMLKVVVRDDYFGFRPIDYLLNKAISPFAIPIKRTWVMGELSEKEKRRIREANTKQLDSLFDPRKIRYDRAILPEATTKKNGAFNKIHSGAWRVSHRVHDGQLEALNCVPVGNTLDNMSSIPGKHLTFMNIGGVFQYSPADYVEGEDEEVYTKRDIAKFARTVKENFIDLHTFTLGQLGGMFILSKPLKGDRSNQSFSRLELLTRVKETLEALNRVEDGRSMYIDPELERGEWSFGMRFNNFVDNLCRRGYGYEGSNGILHIDTAKLMKVPHNSRYKAINPLRYLTNKLIDVSQERPAIAEVVRDVFGFEVQRYEIK